MTIVGAAELTVTPIGGGAFGAELLKIAEPAGAKAGDAAGKAFSKAFLAASRGGASPLTTVFKASAAEAGVSGREAGTTFATGFSEGIRVNGQAATSLFGVGGSAAAETQGVEVGRSYSRGVILGSKESAEIQGITTVGVPAAEAEAEGVTTGRIYGRGFATGAAETSDAGTILNRAAATSTALIGRQGGAAGKVFGTAFGSAAVPLAAVVLGAVSAKLAGDFEQQTNVLVTAAGEQQKNLGKVQTGIKSIAVQTGTAWQQVTDAEYTATKAGFNFANGGLKVVSAAAQGAREEGAQLSTVTTGLTTALTDYKLPASDAVRVTDQLKTGAGQAKTNFEGFTGALGAILPRASAVGISLADVTGVLDSVTQSGVGVQQGSQNIAQTIKNLSAPIGTQVAEFGQLGISVTDVTTRLGDKSPSNPNGRGLAGTLDYLSQTVLQKLGPSGTLLLNTFNQSKLAASDAQTEFNALGPAAQKIAKGYEDGTVSAKDFRTESRNLGGEQSNLAQQFLGTYNQAHGFQQAIKAGGPAAQSYLNAINKLTGGQQGVTVALATTGGQALITQQRIKNIADAAKDAGTSVSGWKITQHNFNTELGSFKQEAEVTGINLGTRLLPPLKAILGVLAQHPAVLEAAAFGVLGLGAAWATVKVGGIISDFGTLIGRITGIGGASAAAAPEVAALGDASAAAAPEVAALGGAEGLGAVEAGLGGAEGAATGLGGAFAAGGLVAGGAAVLGIGALALASKQLVDAWDGQKGNLPTVTAFANAITTGGLGGKQGKNVITTALTQAGSGDNRKENDQQYLSRTLATPEASALGLSVKGLDQVIQKGSQTDLTNYLTQLRSLGFELKGSPATIGKVADYLQDLFSRYNTGRVAASQFTAQQKAQAKVLEDASKSASTNVGVLAKTYDLSKQKATELAFANNVYNATLKTQTAALQGGSMQLEGNAKDVFLNQSAFKDLTKTVFNHAQTVLNQTGDVKESNAAFKDGITQIEGNAEKLGYNKSQVDQYVGSLNLVPPQKVTDVTANTADANNSVLTFLASLAQIPGEKDLTLRVNEAFSGPSGAAPGSNIANLFGFNGQQVAAGGPIFGSGPKGKDSVLAMLAPGEHVWTADEVDKAGGHGAMYAARSAIKGMADGGAVDNATAVNAYLKALAKGNAQVAKISVTDVLKIDTKDIGSGSSAIAAAVKEGNGPLQVYIGALLKNAQGNLYTTGLAAVKDGKVSPAELAAVNAQAKQVTDLTATLTKLNTVNAGLVTSLNSFVSAQSQFRDTLQSNISQGAGFSDLLKLSGSPGDLQGQITANLADVKGFAAKIAELKSRGFSDAIIRDVANDGITQGTLYADLLLTSTKAQVKSLDSSFGALTSAELGTANAITASTAGTIPGLTKASAGVYIEQAIFQPGANVDALVGKAESTQRTGAVTVHQANTFQGVDLATAYAQSTRELSLALQKAGV